MLDIHNQGNRYTPTNIAPVSSLGVEPDLYRMMGIDVFLMALQALWGLSWLYQAYPFCLERWFCSLDTGNSPKKSRAYQGGEQAHPHYK